MKVLDNLGLTLKAEDVTRVARVVVEHAWYGCDTGCCGNAISLEDANGDSVAYQFEFSHDVEWLRTVQREVADKLGCEIGRFEAGDYDRC